jgi:Flp pilus assembly protein TadG
VIERSTAARCAGFLMRLRHDLRGNTLAIVAAALIPLSAMIGSGVDMSRAYMAKTRLQSACDAAALAGRRVMQNDTLDSNVRNEATRFFRFNFPQGLYQATSFNPVVTRPESGKVRVTASTTIPTSVMRIFGFATLPLEATCDASLNFVNTDIMLVLDVTGSMNEDVNGNTTYDAANRKITGLRNAVMGLYDELAPVQTQLQANGLRLRYGVVPYSSTVNVGALIRQANPDYLADHADIPTRVAQFTQPFAEYIPETQPPSAPVQQVYSSSVSQSNCDKYGRNVAFSGFNSSATSGGGPAPATTWTRTFSNNETQGADWGWSGSDTSGTTRSCRRWYVQTNTNYETVYRYRSAGFTYQNDSIDVSRYKLGETVRIATDGAGDSATSGPFDPLEVAANSDGEAGQNVQWKGCIVERETVSTITATSGYAIPAQAYDLDINLIPHDEETRWRPFFPELVHRRTAGTESASSGTLITSLDEGYWACPSEAHRLQGRSRSQMQSYVDALRPVGGTYHDIGMIWGARMISSGGIFADSQPTYNGMPVSRHLIFMTDGQLAPNCNTYTAYGIEQNDRRVTNSSTCSQQYERHLQRFRMICNAVKGMNVSVWVIAFGTSLSADMSSCASNANQASTASSSTALISRFREIGSNIGALRLTQ